MERVWDLIFFVKKLHAFAVNIFFGLNLISSLHYLLFNFFLFHCATANFLASK